LLWFFEKKEMIFLGATTTIVTSRSHSWMTIHLLCGECFSIKWFMIIGFGGVAPNQCLVGQTNFGGCCINGISSPSFIVDVDWHNTT
jgi:hypothetical protein